MGQTGTNITQPTQIFFSLYRSRRTRLSGQTVVVEEVKGQRPGLSGRGEEEGGCVCFV